MSLTWRWLRYFLELLQLTVHVENKAFDSRPQSRAEQRLSSTLLISWSSVCSCFDRTQLERHSLAYKHSCIKAYNHSHRIRYVSIKQALKKAYKSLLYPVISCLLWDSPPVSVSGHCSSPVCSFCSSQLVLWSVVYTHTQMEMTGLVLSVWAVCPLLTDSHSVPV